MKSYSAIKNIWAAVFGNKAIVSLSQVHNPLESLLSEFDEEYYISRNSDVAAAVLSGQFSSGRDHFLKFGHREKRLFSRQIQVPFQQALPLFHHAQIWEKKSLRSFLNILLNVAARKLRSRVTRGLPFIMYYEPTTVCNLKCPSCPTGRGILDRPKPRFSDLGQFRNTMDALGKNVFFLFMYNWGEPLLHKEFASLVRIAAEKGIVVMSSSNLSIPLSEDQCEAIVSSGLYSLKVGIDGATPEIHAMYRRGSKLSVVHENLQKLVSAKRKLRSNTPVINVLFHVFRHNEHEISFFMKQMQGIGVDSYGATSSWLPPDGEVTKATNPQYDIYRISNQAIERLKNKKESLRPCSWLYYVSTINPDGGIAPCCSGVSASGDFGNLIPSVYPHEIGTGFRAVWNNKKYRTARGLFHKGKPLQDWSSQNLQELKPDGMNFSRNERFVDIMCQRCSIPHTIEQWDSYITTMHDALQIYSRMGTNRGLSLSAVMNKIKVGILSLAVRLSK